MPAKTIIATIGLLVAAYLAWLLLRRVATVLQLVVVAAFFALALNPAVDLLHRRVRLRRGIAATVVFLLGALALNALAYLFVRPLFDQTLEFIDRFPELVQEAQNGEGTIGELVKRYEVEQWVADNQARVRESVTQSTGSVLTVASTVFSTIASLLTVAVLTFLMLLEGPQMLRAPLVLLDKKAQLHIRRVAADCAKAVTGYVTGNLLISLIAGTVTFVTLTALGVPFAAVLAVWVAVADLIPLVGATLGAIPTIAVAFLHSTRSGVIALVVYVVYQQIENHVLQPTIMSRTVKLNPLTVLVSVLLGVELAGFLGALFAIPVAGVIQVVLRDLLDQRTGGVKEEPTVGVEEVPVSGAEGPA